MSYQYGAYSAWLASAEGIEAVGKVLRKVETLLVPAGAARMCELWPDGVGDAWRMLAAVDHVVALGVIREVEQIREPMAQFRIFVKVDRS